MANTTITGLPNATVPLDGTERVPMDQAGATVDASALAIAQTLADATTSVAGKMTATDKTKLDGVAAGATANSSDATLLARANHTGTQAANTITGLATVGTTGAYADLSGKPTLGTAAAKNTGTAAGNVVELDGSARLPAVDGSQLTGINAATDLTYTAATRVLASSTGTDATLTLVTSTNAGLAPASGGGTTNFLRADGTFAAPPGGTPGGSTTQFQYNNAGAFGGLSTFTTDGTNVTLTGRFISSLNGAASAPPGTFTGTWFTGGSATTTKPQVLIEPTGATSTAWSTAGTGFGVNAASGFAGNLLDLQVNGTRQTVVGSTGLVQTNLDVYARGILTNTGLGSSDWANWIGSHGNQLKDSAILSWTSGVATLTADVILRRDAANTLAQRNGTNAQTSRVYNTYTSATNYELGKLEWSSNVFRIGTEKGSGGGTARTVEVHTDSIARLALDTTGSVRVVTALTVATLPGTPAVGMIARVTDATAPAVGVTVVGGGAAAALVWYNGANWSVIGV